jgi:hypothetical protein
MMRRHDDSASPVSLDEAKAAKAPALRQFRKLVDVVGIGITRVQDDYAVKINLSKPPAHGVKLPTHIGRVPIRVEVTGSLRAQS